MLFYLLFGPSAVLLMIMWIDLRKKAKHDKVLFRFCQIRRDIITLMYAEHHKMKSADYKAIRTLLDATSLTIHEFNQLKATMFNLRWFIDWMRKYKTKAVKIDELSTSDERIMEIKNKYRIATLAAFLSYTPLIRSQITLMVFLALSKFLLSVGIKSLKLQSLLNYLAWLKEDMIAHSNHTPQHA
jgi:hypothetical protein